MRGMFWCAIVLSSAVFLSGCFAGSGCGSFGKSSQHAFCGYSGQRAHFMILATGRIDCCCEVHPFTNDRWSGTIQSEAAQGKGLKFEADKNGIEIDGKKYDFTNGRIFRVAELNGKQTVRQMDKEGKGCMMIPLGGDLKQLTL